MSAVDVADHEAAARLILRDIAESFDDLIRVSSYLDDTYSLAHVLADLRDVKSTAGEVYKQVEAHLLGTMGEKRVEVPGLGVIEGKRGVRRKAWDDASLWRVVVAMGRDERRADPETGEYEPAEEAVARVLFECARPTWRVTPLKARGLQVDEFCQEESGDYGVVLPPRDLEERVA